MPNADNVNTYIVSVSGGGEQPSNRTCRNRLIKHLVQKGFNVVYEKMITMPCNYAETAPDVINAIVITSYSIHYTKLYEAGEGFIRLNLACPRSLLDEGLGRLLGVIEALS